MTPTEPEAVPPAWLRYVEAAVTGRSEQAMGIARDALREADAPVDVYIDVFQSALHEVGRRWEAAGLTIAEEHMATATTQFILGVLHEELPRIGRRKGTAVVTGVLGEQHAVGASIIANVLDEDGWEVHHLGTNLPAGAIMATVTETRATLLAVSVTMPSCVAGVRELIALVRATSPDPPRILVGGPAFQHDPDLWRAVGADAYAPDARNVAEAARGGSRPSLVD